MEVQYTNQESAVATMGGRSSFLRNRPEELCGGPDLTKAYWSSS